MIESNLCPFRNEHRMQVLEIDHQRSPLPNNPGVDCGLQVSKHEEAQLPCTALPL